jgi:glutamate racemase
MGQPIGILDSGVGGLSVASKIFTHLPHEEILYFGDTANVPYGDKTPQQLRAIVFRILDFFQSRDAKAVVMACNSSSAIVLDDARMRYPMPIFGVIEPAIREALTRSRQKRIGLIANLVTVSSGAHQRMMTRISGNGVRIHPQACPQLVPLVEEGILTGQEADRVLMEYLHPLEARGIDTLILGCTHYPFLEESIRKILGKEVAIIDPAEHTALSLRDMLREKGMERDAGEPSRHEFMVSGDPERFREIGSRLLGRPLGEVKKAPV